MRDTPKAVCFVEAGKEIESPQAGDFFLVHRKTFLAKLIQFGQRLRFSKEEAYWNHAGLFIDDNGTIIEATGDGVMVRNILNYRDIEYIVVKIDASDEDRQQILKFAIHQVGRSYGFLTDVNLALWCIFGGRFDFSLEGQFICSGLVAQALERAGYIFDRDPTHETPADLARHFKVHRILRNS